MREWLHFLGVVYNPRPFLEKLVKRERLLTVVSYFTACAMIISGFLTPIYWQSFGVNLNFIYGILGFFVGITASNFIHALLVDLVFDPRIQKGKFIDTLLACFGISGTFCLLLTIIWAMHFNLSFKGWILAGVLFVFIWWFLFQEARALKGIYAASLVTIFVVELVFRILSFLIAVLIISMLTGTANQIKQYLF